MRHVFLNNTHHISYIHVKVVHNMYNGTIWKLKKIDLNAPLTKTEMIKIRVIHSAPPCFSLVFALTLLWI